MRKQVALLLTEIDEIEARDGDEPSSRPRIALGDYAQNERKRLACQLLKQGDLRHQHFRGELFSDPVWWMLLDLYVAELDQKTISVGSLSIAARVPPTTALRWIGTLVEQGLAERVPDPLDGRRVNVRMNSDAFVQMEAYLVRIASSPDFAIRPVATEAGHLFR
jgi:hypothetical protein